MVILIILAAVVALCLVAAVFYISSTRHKTVVFDNGSFMSSCLSTPCQPGLTCDSQTSTCLYPVGAVCTSGSDCANMAFCSGTCITGTRGDLNQPCPCISGYTCIGDIDGYICKVSPLQPCTQNQDCANNNCVSSNPSSSNYGKCSKGYPDGYIGCSSDAQCASGVCSGISSTSTVGTCSNNVPFGTPGAPCGQGCVDYPTSSCNAGLYCQCDKGNVGLCTQTGIGLFLPCSNTSICDSSLTCTRSLCQFPTATTVLTPGLYRIDVAEMVGSTTVKAQVVPFPTLGDNPIMSFVVSDLHVVYVMYGQEVYKSVGTGLTGITGWQKLEIVVQAIFVLGETLYYYNQGIWQYPGGKIDEGVFDTCTSICVNKGGDTMVVSKKNIYRSDGGSAYVKLNFPGYIPTTTIETKQAYFSPNPGTGTSENEDTCSSTNPCVPRANINTAASNSPVGGVNNVFFYGDYNGFFIPTDTVNYALSNTAENLQTTVFSVVFANGNKQNLYISTGNVGGTMPFVFNKGITAVAQTWSYIWVNS